MTIVGSHDTVYGSSNGDAVTFDGTGDTGALSNGTVSQEIGGIVTTINGSKDAEDGAAHDTFHSNGSADIGYGSYITNDPGPGDVGDTTVGLDGSSVDDPVPSSSPITDPNTCSGFNGLVALAPTYIDIIAQNQITDGLTAQAALTEADWNLDLQAIASAASPTTVAAPRPYEGAAWSGPVVTWSFATGSGSEYNPLSGTVQAQYQEAIEQALQTWANATGLIFQEVPDSKASDIRIGWEDLDTSTTGVIGSASIMPINGVMQPDVEVRLEDPSQDAFITAAGGALTYSGTGTTLDQAALHEIGHALGLGASSDPNSIMFPELGTSNPTLDATDMANLAPLYGATAGLTASALLAQGI